MKKEEKRKKNSTNCTNVEPQWHVYESLVVFMADTVFSFRTGSSRRFSRIAPTAGFLHRIINLLEIRKNYSERSVITVMGTSEFTEYPIIKLSCWLRQSRIYCDWLWTIFHHVFKWSECFSIITFRLNIKHGHGRSEDIYGYDGMFIKSEMCGR